MDDYLLCFGCGDKLTPRHVAWLYVNGKLVPFHQSLLRDCHNEQLRAEHNERQLAPA